MTSSYAGPSKEPDKGNPDSEYEIVSLRRVLSTAGEDGARTLLEGLSCQRDQDREDFLHSNAISMEKRDVSRTYLAIRSSDAFLLGYFSIGLKCMLVPPEADTISKSFRKRMNVDPNSDVAQAYLLGQLGRDDHSPRGFGAVLLEEALDRLRTSKGIVGCRLVRLDCADELIGYYTEKGFRTVVVGSPGDLNHMVILIRG